MAVLHSDSHSSSAISQFGEGGKKKKYLHLRFMIHGGSCMCDPLRDHFVDKPCLSDMVLNGI